MNAGYYVTLIRGARVGYLVGPLSSEQAARDRIPAARKVAEEIDPFTCFDLFGTARLERIGELPEGVLNSKVEGNDNA